MERECGEIEILSEKRKYEEMYKTAKLLIISEPRKVSKKGMWDENEELTAEIDGLKKILKRESEKDCEEDHKYQV